MVGSGHRSQVYVRSFVVNGDIYTNVDAVVGGQLLLGICVISEEAWFNCMHTGHESILAGEHLEIEGKILSAVSRAQVQRI